MPIALGPQITSMNTPVVFWVHQWVIFAIHSFLRTGNEDIFFFVFFCKKNLPEKKPKQAPRISTRKGVSIPYVISTPRHHVWKNIVNYYFNISLVSWKNVYNTHVQSLNPRMFRSQFFIYRTPPAPYSYFFLPWPGFDKHWVRFQGGQVVRLLPLTMPCVAFKKRARLLSPDHDHFHPNTGWKSLILW